VRILRKLIPAAVLLCACQFAFPQTFVIQQKPPALRHGYPATLLVLDDAGKTVTSIPLGSEPGDQQFAFSPFSHTLYSLNLPDKAKSADRVLSAIDPATGRVVRQITVGAGREVTLFASKDGRRLFCYTYLGPGYFVGPRGVSRVSESPLRPKITVIDTALNEVIVTYELRGAFLATKGGKFKSQFLATGDGERLIAMCSGFDLHDKLKGRQIEVFSGKSPNPAFVTDPQGHVASWLVTEDGRFLITSVEGSKKSPPFLSLVNLETGAERKPELTGTLRMMIPSQDARSLFVAADKDKSGPTALDVVDLATGKVSERPLIDLPARFVRLGPQGGLWVVNSLEMRPLSETGELGQQSISLNKPRKKEEQDTEAETAFLNGYPGEVVSLGEDRAAMMILTRKGETNHRVALLDLKKLQVDSIVRTMSTGEAGRIRTEHYMSALELSFLPGALGNAAFAGAMLSGGFNNEMLVAGPDGKFIYALDTDSHEVTIVDVQAGTVLNRLPVDHSIVRLQLTGDSKHLLCLGKEIQKINLVSNQLGD